MALFEQQPSHQAGQRKQLAKKYILHSRLSHYPALGPIENSPAASDFAYMEGTNYHVRRTITTNPCPQPDDANAAQRQQFKGERAVKAGRGFVPAGANGETQAGERVSWRKHKMMAGGRGLGPGAVSPRWCEGMEAQSQVRQFPVEFQADYFPGSNAGGSIPKFIATYVRSCCCRSTWNVASRF